MSDCSPAPGCNTGGTYKLFTRGQKAVAVLAVLAVAIGGFSSVGWAAKPVLQRNLSADAQTVTFQNRLNASLQNMLDSVVGPGHAVVTTTAELNFDQVETRTKTYTSDPAVAALAESISREAYNGTGTGNGGVLGADNPLAPNTADQYENSRIVRNNAVNEIIQTRRTAPGAVKRLNVAVLLDSTTAGAVNPAQLQQLVSAAVGIDPTRGDSITVAAMPFDTSTAEQAQLALAASAVAAAAAKQESLFKTISLALLVLLLLLLAWRASRRARKHKVLSAGELAHLRLLQAASDQRQLAQLTVSIPPTALKPVHQIDPRRQQAIERLAEEKPQEVASLLRGWTTPDS